MPRVDGGPEALLRLDERRRLQGRPPLGPALLTADAQRAGLPVPVVTVTDTPLARETDYGRVDDHSSAIRAPGDQRHTFNRVPDYPADAPPVYGDWIGGRLSVSSSAADSTALPNVSPATGPAAAIDGDPATSWVSNALQAAVGQWLRVDFDNPITNAMITITPSATAVGAQVRKLEIATATGTTTVRFDEPGQPLTVALPYGETPWVRVTAVGTDDGSAGVQFGHHRHRDHPVRRERLRASGRPAAHRRGAATARRLGCGAAGIWARSCSAATGAPRVRIASAVRRRWRSPPKSR